MFEVGQTIRIKESAFPGSDEPNDIGARGQVGTIVTSLEDLFGSDWADCWEVELDDSGMLRLVQVLTREIENVAE